MIYHKNLPASENHLAYAFTYTNAATRGASTLTSSDVGKLALQSDENSLWLLVAAPNNWVRAGGIDIASDTNLGGVKIPASGSGLAIDGTGNLTHQSPSVGKFHTWSEIDTSGGGDDDNCLFVSANEKSGWTTGGYVLPEATGTTLGGVMVPGSLAGGTDALGVNVSGELSLGPATADRIGGVKVIANSGLLVDGVTGGLTFDVTQAQSVLGVGSGSGVPGTSAIDKISISSWSSLTYTVSPVESASEYVLSKPNDFDLQIIHTRTAANNKEICFVNIINTDSTLHWDAFWSSASGRLVYYDSLDTFRITNVPSISFDLFIHYHML